MRPEVCGPGTNSRGDTSPSPQDAWYRAPCGDHMDSDRSSAVPCGSSLPGGSWETGGARTAPVAGRRVGFPEEVPFSTSQALITHFLGWTRALHPGTDQPDVPPGLHMPCLSHKPGTTRKCSYGWAQGRLRLREVKHPAQGCTVGSWDLKSQDLGTLFQVGLHVATLPTWTQFPLCSFSPAGWGVWWTRLAVQAWHGYRTGRLTVAHITSRVRVPGDSVASRPGLLRDQTGS